MKDRDKEEQEDSAAVDGWKRCLVDAAESLGISKKHHAAKDHYAYNEFSGRHYKRRSTPAQVEYGQVSRAALVTWLGERGPLPAFFSTARHVALPQHWEYSNFPEELRAAIDAFTAVKGDEKALAGKSPKQALAAWLNENKQGMTGKAKERVATVANWEAKGGAPKTPQRGT